MVMKKRVTSGKARSRTGWHKHLRSTGKRAANRDTRRAFKGENREGKTLCKGDDLCY